MIRILLYLALLIGAAVGLAWFADRPGTITINWLQHEAQLSVFQGVVILALGIAGTLFAIWLVTSIIYAPGRLARRVRIKRRRKGFKALQDGIFAVGAGDEARAARLAGIANKYLPNRPLTRLLRAQAAQLTGDRMGAQRIFTSMLDEPSSRMLALRGLFLEAQREGQTEAARHYVQQAMDMNSALAWPAAALFEFQCKERDWNGALNTVAIARQQRNIDRKTADRRRAVLLTALAQEADERGDNGRAAELALEGHRLAPDLVPAAAIAGRMLAAQGNTSRAARILGTTWELSPHPDLASAYAHARPGDSPRDRLTRVKALAGITPGHYEAAIAVASAAIEAREWAEARTALDFLAHDKPSARVCTLMARIEGGDNRDAGKVREWLAKALRAPRDPAWVADGVISDDWMPVSPVTGALDVFVWEIPPVRMRKPGVLDEALLPELEAAELGASILIDGRDEQGKDAVLSSSGNGPAVEGHENGGLESRPPEPAPKSSEVVLVPVSAKPTPVATPLKPTIAQPKPAITDIFAGDQVLPAAFPSGSSGWEPSQPSNPAVKSIAPVPAKTEAETAERGPTRTDWRKTPPKVFVPDRLPDDPGPEDADADDTLPTPLARYRKPVKDTA